MNLHRLSLAFYRVVFIFFLFFFIPTPGFSINISTEAVEPISGRTIANVKNIAIAKALAKALEEAALRIDSNSDKGVFQKLKSVEVITYIKAYRIINETSSGGEYEITLEVDVDSQRIKNKIEDFGIDNTTDDTTDDTTIFPKKPIIFIKILQNPESNPIINTLSASDIEREMSTILIGSGYGVVTESSSDVKLETYIGIKTTEIKLEETTYNTIGYVHIKAKDRKGKLVAEVSDSSFVNGANLGNTGLEALKRAGAGAAKKLRSELDKKSDPQKRAETIEVSFTGLKNYIQYERIDKILTSSVPNINSRVFTSGGTVSFHLLSKVALEELASIIESLLPKDLPFKLDDTSYDKIKFRAVY